MCKASTAARALARLLGARVAALLERAPHTLLPIAVPVRVTRFARGPVDRVRHVPRLTHLTFLHSDRWVNDAIWNSLAFSTSNTEAVLTSFA